MHFYTKWKTVTTNWELKEDAQRWGVAMPKL